MRCGYGNCNINFLELAIDKLNGFCVPFIHAVISTIRLFLLHICRCYENQAQEIIHEAVAETGGQIGWRAQRYEYWLSKQQVNTYNLEEEKIS